MSTFPNDISAVCPVCKRVENSRFFMNKEGYDLYECSDCEHIFVWPIPGIEALKQIYSFANGYQSQPKTMYGDNTEFSEKTRESLKQLENFCSRRERLLDVGCSSGKFLWLAKKRGWVAVCGVELNPDTAQIATDNGLEVSVGELASANYSRGSFDAVHLGDVIEHVPDPGQTLRELVEFLDPSGVIALATPNHDAIFPSLTLRLHRFFKMPWSSVTPPYHLNQFSLRSLERLLQSVDLEVVHRQYRGCDLHYELGETHILRSFREALAGRRVFLAAGRLVFAVLTASAYTVMYAIDRCCVWKTKDSQMLLLARKAASTAAQSVSSAAGSTDNSG